MDTSETMHRLLVERLRQMTCQERLNLTFERIQFMRKLRESTEGLRQGS